MKTSGGTHHLWRERGRGGAGERREGAGCGAGSGLGGDARIGVCVDASPLHNFKQTLLLVWYHPLCAFCTSVLCTNMASWTK